MTQEPEFLSSTSSLVKKYYKYNTNWIKCHVIENISYAKCVQFHAECFAVFIKNWWKTGNKQVRN